MDVNWIPFAFPGIPNVACAFQTRAGAPDLLRSDEFAGGNISLETGPGSDQDESAALASRHALQKGLGFTHWQEVRQVHGDQVILEPEPGNIERAGSIEADGLATTRPGQALVVKSADCQPVMLAHKSGKYVAALHVGWRGNVLRFPRQGARAFCEEYELDPAEVLAVRGPSLGPGASEFKEFETEFGERFRPYYKPETHKVDLWRLTREQLEAAGLRPENIFGLDLCTFSLPELFFSYRRNNACGRQASLIWIRE